METIKDKINNILGHSCVVIAGQSPSGESYNTVGKGIEFHQGKKAFGDNVVQHSGIWTTEITKVAEPGDILLSVRAPVGPTNLTDRQLCIGRGLAAIRCSEKVLPKYVLFALKSIEYKIVGHEGVGFNSINKQQIEQLPLPIIPLKEQEEIVAYLDGEFERIEKLKRNAEAALQHTKDLFQSTLKQLLAPKPNWEEKKLGRLTTKIGSGATPKGGKKIYIEKGCSFIRSMNVLYGEFKYDELAHIDDNAAGQLKGVAIEENDVLLNITGASIARCCVVPKDVIPARVNQHVSIIRLTNVVLPHFLAYQLINPYNQKTLLTIGESGSTRQALTKTDIENFTVSIPPLAEQQAIVSRLDTLSEHCRKLEQNYRDTLTLCDDLKQALLREVFE